MSTAAVILNYNDADTTIEAVERIRDFCTIDHVIVVDNASTDDSAARIGSFLYGLEEERPEDAEEQRYMLVISDKNGGYGYGNNIGVRYAYEVLHDDLCLIANPDACFGEDLAGLMAAALSDGDTALCGAVMRSGKGGLRDFAASAWPRRGLLASVLSSGPVTRRIFGRYLYYGRDHYLGKSKTAGKRQVSFSRDGLRISSTALNVGVVHGSLLMVDAEKFLAVGGYDEHMFLYCEEDVLGRKLWNGGYVSSVITEPQYIHKGAQTMKRAGLGALKRQLIRQKSERYYYRHYLSSGNISMGAIAVFQTVVLFETLLLEGVLRITGRS